MWRARRCGRFADGLFLDITALNITFGTGSTSGAIQCGGQSIFLFARFGVFIVSFEVDKRP
jgi:hypothetical protein